MPGIQKSMYFHHKNRIKEKNYILISRNSEKALNKIQQLFIIKKKNFFKIEV